MNGKRARQLRRDAWANQHWLQGKNPDMFIPEWTNGRPPSKKLFDLGTRGTLTGNKYRQFRRAWKRGEVR